MCHRCRLQVVNQQLQTSNDRLVLVKRRLQGKCFAQAEEIKRLKGQVAFQAGMAEGWRSLLDQHFGVSQSLERRIKALKAASLNKPTNLGGQDEQSTD